MPKHMPKPLGDPAGQRAVVNGAYARAKLYNSYVRPQRLHYVGTHDVACQSQTISKTPGSTTFGTEIVLRGHCWSSSRAPLWHTISSWRHVHSTLAMVRAMVMAMTSDTCCRRHNERPVSKAWSSTSPTDRISACGKGSRLKCSSSIVMPQPVSRQNVMLDSCASSSSSTQGVYGCVLLLLGRLEGPP